VAPPGNQAANGENKLQPVAMGGPGLLDRNRIYILKYQSLCHKRKKHLCGFSIDNHKSTMVNPKGEEQDE
jgi:hypothetical protein